MKKTKRILILFCLLTLVNCKSSWIEKNEKNIRETNKNIILVDRFEKFERKDHYIKSQLHKLEKFRVLKTEFFSDTLMRTKSETYLKDSLLIKKMTFGIVAISPPLNKNSPYAKVFEEIYYFNSTNSGILKERKIEIKNFGEYEVAKSKLMKMKFETSEINEKDYIKMKQEYEQIIELYKKY
tara:strand:- start:80 stop:625 length:546 start_codon:yes stop_codon:yes gene_type:complete